MTEASKWRRALWTTYLLTLPTPTPTKALPSLLACFLACCTSRVPYLLHTLHTGTYFPPSSYTPLPPLQQGPTGHPKKDPGEGRGGEGRGGEGNGGQTKRNTMDSLLTTSYIHYIPTGAVYIYIYTYIYIYLQNHYIKPYS